MKVERYAFLDKINLKRKSKNLSTMIEQMMESFDFFIKLLDGLEDDEYIEFTHLKERAGLTTKLLKQITTGVGRYRDIYFKMLNKATQTSLDKFKEVD